MPVAGEKRSSVNVPTRGAWAAVFAIAIALRFWGLGRESYWLDELATLDVITEPWPRFIGVLARFDNHPPLYFALAKAWASLVGTREVPLRALSAAFGLVSVGLAAALARTWVSPRSALESERGDATSHANAAALAAAMIVAVAPVSVRHAREARMYAVLECATLATVWLLVHALRRSRSRTLLAYAASTAIALYTHVYGLLLVAAHAIVLLGLAVVGRAHRRAATRALGALCVSVVLFAPWIPVVRARTATVGRGFWLTQPAWTWPVEWGGGGAWGAAFIAGALTAACAGVVSLWRRDRRDATVAVATLVGLTVVPIAAAALYRPVFSPKYAIGAAALAFTLAAVGVSTARRGARAMAVLALAGLGLVATMRGVVGARVNEDWRGVSQFATAQCRRHGAQLAAARYASMYRHYVPSECPVLDLEPLLRSEGDLTREALRQRLASMGTVWLLEVHPPRTDARVEAVLQQSHRRAGERSWLHARATQWLARSP